LIPGNFDYHRPTSVGEVVALLAQYGDDSQILAGGHSLIPMMKLRLAQPAHLIDLQGIADLKGVRVAGDTVEIGAMTSQQDLVADETLAAAAPILRETALLIADPQVRALGTIGGNVANGDPGNDMPAVMMALDAEYVLAGPDGERTVKARDYYEAAYFTSREDGEMLIRIRFATPPSGHGWAYSKMKRKVGDYATAAAAAILTMDGGTCTAATITLTNVHQTPLWAEDAGRGLVGTPVDAAAIKAAAQAAAAITEPVADMRGPADYRSHVAGVMVRRALVAARDRAA
jgi:carbon-monoxide dehydrogenase medium subunit